MSFLAALGRLVAVCARVAVLEGNAALRRRHVDRLLASDPEVAEMDAWLDAWYPRP